MIIIGNKKNGTNLLPSSSPYQSILNFFGDFPVIWVNFL